MQKMTQMFFVTYKSRISTHRHVHNVGEWDTLFLESPDWLAARTRDHENDLRQKVYTARTCAENTVHEPPSWLISSHVPICFSLVNRLSWGMNDTDSERYDVRCIELIKPMYKISHNSMKISIMVPHRQKFIQPASKHFTQQRVKWKEMMKASNRT